MTTEERLQIRNPPMIDVRVRPGHSPQLRVGTEGAEHVLVDLDLQIDANRTIRSNDDVRTHPNRCRHVTTGVSDPAI